MRIDQVSQTVAGLVEPVAEAHGLELVDVEFQPGGRRSILRLLLDRPGGITVDDLAVVSREVSDLLDAHDAVPGGYTLECSSPGVNRPLKSREDFARYRGRVVRIRTNGPVQGARNFSGELLSADDDGVEIDDRAHGRLSLPYGVIQKAHYEHDFARDLRGERN